VHVLEIILPYDVDPELEEKYRRLKYMVRAKVKVVTVNCSTFKEYLEYIKEMYGGRGLVEYIYVDAGDLPVFILDGQVIVEGNYPEVYELLELLRYYGVKTRRRRRYVF